MYRDKLLLADISKSQNIRFGVGYSKLSKSPFFSKYFEACPLRMKDIFEINKGETITEEECEPGDIPVVAGGKALAYYHSVSNRKANIITVSASGAYSGFINFWDVDIWASDCSTIRSKDEKLNSTRFWFYLLRLIQPDVYRFQTGAGQPHVYPQDLQYIRIPEIPIEYQKEILDKIKPIEEELTKQKAKVLSKREILDKIFENEVHNEIDLRQGMTYGTQFLKNSSFNRFRIRYSGLSNHKGLRLSARASSPIFEQLNNIMLKNGYKRIADIVSESVHNGTAPVYNPGGNVYVIKTSNVTNDGISYNNAEYVTSEQYESTPKAQVKCGDIVVCNIGKGSLGKVDYCDNDTKMFAASETMIIRVNSEIYNPKFLCYFLRSIFGVYQFEREYTGTTNQIHIDPISVSQFLIPDIQLSDQERVVSLIENDFRANDELKRNITQLEDKVSLIIRDSLQAYNV